MIAKLGFILIVLLFGALMFVAGTLAPKAVREPIVNAAGQLMARLPTSGDAKSASRDAPSEAGTSAGKEDDKPLPYETLLLRRPLPDKAQFALQVGVFAEAAGADPLLGRLRKLGYRSKAIPVVDQNGALWVVLAAGQFASPDDARAARGPLSRGLGLNQSLTLILLPPEKKAG